MDWKSTFGEIVGHEKQLALLRENLEKGNLAHAYLFSGPSGVGKYSVAKKMSEMLQGRKINYLDTIELFDHEGSIKIKQLQEIIERMSKTGQSEYKILLMKNIERMTIPAANSFLKFLEEPSGDTVFLMTTENLKMILPTIISRVRVLNFGPVDEVEMLQFLREKFPDVDEESVNLVAKFALGRVGAAVQILSDSDNLQRFLAMNARLVGLLENNNLCDRFALVEELNENKDDLEHFFDLLSFRLRDFILKNNEREGLKHGVSALVETRKARNLLKKNVNFRLVLENLMLSL